MSVLMTRWPPNRIEASTRIPIACQNVIRLTPNTAGMVAFQIRRKTIVKTTKAARMLAAVIAAVVIGSLAASPIDARLVGLNGANLTRAASMLQCGSSQARAVDCSGNAGCGGRPKGKE